MTRTAPANTDLVTLKGLSAIHAFIDFYNDPVGCVEKIHQRHGNTIALDAPFLRPSGTPQSYLLVGPDHNRAILLNQESFRPTGAWPVRGKKGSSLQNLRRNILCMRGEEHDAHLAAILPLMSRPRVKLFFDRVMMITTENTKRWPTGQTIDATALARTLTQHLSFDLLFGAQSPDEIEGFGSRIDAFHNDSWSRAALSFPIDAPMTPYRQLMRSAKALEDFSIDWNAAEKKCPVHDNIRAAMNDVVLPDGKTPDKTQQAANVAAIGMASFETSASTLSWALFMLTQHPTIHAALVDELDNLGPLSKIDAETLDQQPLLDGVVKETMRLITPVPVIGFEAMDHATVAGINIRKGARVFISPHLTHRLPSLYERPRQFLPDRWSSIKPSAYEYLPFNAGPRRCPGIWFASANLKIALASILTQYSVELAPNAVINRGYAATTISKTGIPVIFSARTEKFSRSNCAGTILKFFDAQAA